MPGMQDDTLVATSSYRDRRSTDTGTRILSWIHIVRRRRASCHGCYCCCCCASAPGMLNIRLMCLLSV